MSRLQPKLILLTLFCALGVARPSYAQNFQNLEYRLKAGYFVYFGSGYVKWPPAGGLPRDEFVIGVVGRYPFDRAIAPLPGGNSQIRLLLRGGRERIYEKLGTRKIIVRRYKSVDDLTTKYKPCHILFVCRQSAVGVAAETTQQRLAAATKMVGASPALIIAEAVTSANAELLAKRGAVITYWNDVPRNRVKMIVNRSAERAAKLTVTAELLQLGIVEKLPDR